MAKVVELNQNIVMPIPFKMHTVLINCGFTLVSQDPYRLVYEIENSKRIIFTVGSCFYSECKKDETFDMYDWQTKANLKFAFDLDAIAYLDILNSIGAINYFALPQFQNLLSSALNEMRKNGNGNLVFGYGSDAFNGQYEKRQA